MKALFANTYIVPQSGSNLCHKVTYRFEKRIVKDRSMDLYSHAHLSFWEKTELRSPPAGRNPMVIICMELSLYNLRN